MGSLLSAEQDVVESTDDEESYHSQSEESDASTNSDRFQMSVRRMDALGQGLQTDAVESRQITGDNLQITFEAVREIERNLDLYEKVSLVFLLYGNKDLALQNLLTEIENYRNNTTINPLYNWAQSKHPADKPWQKQLVEALCIIENYSVLVKLGYSKTDLQSRFLPANPNTTVFVSLVRKTLYLMCESFSNTGTLLFLKYLREEFARRALSWEEYEPEYLELHILHCFSQGFVHDCDLSGFVRILKRMNLEQVSLWLESSMDVEMRARFPGQPQEWPKTATVAGAEPKVAEKPTGCSDHSLVVGPGIVDGDTGDEWYKIDPDHIGLCVIFNQKKFHKDQDKELKWHVPIDHELATRNGTEFDRDRLKDTFTRLGFRVEIFEDKTHAEIESCLAQATESFSTRESCLVVCVLSHGVEDCVYGANSVPLPIKNIEDLMHVKKLAGKPKILIIQSCQGKDLQPVSMVTDGRSDGETPVDHRAAPASLQPAPNVHCMPEKADLIVCSSTISRYASVRDEKSGSWYIQELCDRILQECNRNHFADILTKVTGAVYAKRWKKDNRYVCMVPEYRTSFSKKLFLSVVRPEGDS